MDRLYETTTDSLHMLVFIISSTTMILVLGNIQPVPGRLYI